MNTLQSLGVGLLVLGAAGKATYDHAINPYQSSDNWSWQYKGTPFQDKKTRYEKMFDNVVSDSIGYGFQTDSFKTEPILTKPTGLIYTNRSEKWWASSTSNGDNRIGIDIGTKDPNSFVSFVSNARSIKTLQFLLPPESSEYKALADLKDQKKDIQVFMGEDNYKKEYKSNKDKSNLDIRRLISQENILGKETGASTEKRNIHSKITIKDDKYVRLNTRPLGIETKQTGWDKADLYFETGHLGILKETQDVFNTIKQGDSQKQNWSRKDGHNYVFTDDAILKEIAVDINESSPNTRILIQTADYSLKESHDVSKALINKSNTNPILVKYGNNTVPTQLKKHKGITVQQDKIHYNLVYIDDVQGENVLYLTTSRFTESKLGEIGIRLGSKEFKYEIDYLKKQIFDSSDEFDQVKAGRLLTTVSKANKAGIFNPTMRPIFDQGRDYIGLTLSNKQSVSQQFHLATYNATMRAQGRFTSVVDAEDIGTYEMILRNGLGRELNKGELAVAKSFDYSLNSPSLASRINEYFFIPSGMGRVWQEEKGLVPSVFGAVGSLLDDFYLINQPQHTSYKDDGEQYFAAKTTLFQDLMSGSAAGLLATTSSIAVYLAVGEPLKAAASLAVKDSQEALLNAKGNHLANLAITGSLHNGNSTTYNLINTYINKPNHQEFFNINDPKMSVYWLDNLQRQRGAYFFSATVKEFLLDKVNPYKFGSTKFNEYVAAINQYQEVLQSPADIKIVNSVTGIEIDPKNWASQKITLSSGETTIKAAMKQIEDNRPTGKHVPLLKELEDHLEKTHDLKITNVSLERNMNLAKKIQVVLNLTPMPWAWGMFTGRKETVTKDTMMIGNLLDIETFTRHVNASLSNQGFWGAAQEQIKFNSKGTNETNLLYRVTNHLATFSRSILSWNENVAESINDLKHVKRIGETYSNAQVKINKDANDRKVDIRAAKSITDMGHTLFDTSKLDVIAVDELLSAEATFQKQWKVRAGVKSSGLHDISLNATEYGYAVEHSKSSKIGFLLNTLDKESSYLGMKVASNKLKGAKVLGALFLVNLAATEIAQDTGVGQTTTFAAQALLGLETKTNIGISFSSTQFIKYGELAKQLGMGAGLNDVNNNWSNLLTGFQATTSAIGLASWAWGHASYNQISTGAKAFTITDNLLKSLTQEDGTKLLSAAELSTHIGDKQNINLLHKGEKINFNVVRSGANITALKTLTFEVKKNLTSVGVHLGLALAGMQTARFLVSSAINADRQLFGSAGLSLVILGAATVFAAASSIDNVVHTIHTVTGGKAGWNDYRSVNKVTKGIVGLQQGLANNISWMFDPKTKRGVGGRIGIFVGLAAATVGMYLGSPIRGELEGPEANNNDLDAIGKLGRYFELINQRIENKKNSGDPSSVSEQVSPLEINGAIMAVALGKIINPIVGNKQSNTAFVIASQSPFPFLQYYSVLKKVKNSSGVETTTLSLGLQGPPMLGANPINVTLPLAYSYNKTQRTGFMGTGILLNDGNKDGFSLADYTAAYGQIALYSGMFVTGLSTLSRVRTHNNHSRGISNPSLIYHEEPQMVNWLKKGRQKLLGVMELPFTVAQHALKLSVGDIRNPGLRMTKAAYIPTLANVLLAGGITNHLLEVTKQIGNFKDNGNFDAIKFAAIGVAGLGWGMGNYYVASYRAAQTIHALEKELGVKTLNININLPKRLTEIAANFDNMTHSIFNPINKHGAIFKSKVATSFLGKSFNAIGRYGQLALVGAAINFFVTDPQAGRINPELAMPDPIGNKAQGEIPDTYTWGLRRATTTIAGGIVFAGLMGSFTTIEAGNFFGKAPDTERIFHRFSQQLDHVATTEERFLKSKNKGQRALSRVTLFFQNIKLRAYAREFEMVIDGASQSNPTLGDSHNKMKNPHVNINQNISEIGNNVITKLDNWDPGTAGDSLENRLNSGDKRKLQQIVVINDNTFEELGQEAHASPKKYIKKTLIHKLLGMAPSVKTKVISGRIGQAALVSAGYYASLWVAEQVVKSFGYKDIQDAFQADTSANTAWDQFRQGMVDHIKLNSNKDRVYHYDISKGLVGQNIHSSSGEFLLNPDKTVTGSIDKALKNLSQLVVINAPKTFIGITMGGATLTPGDGDLRVKGYFQLQSASQDFSSAMYSMSAVFGLKELVTKGYLSQTVIANMRGIGSLNADSSQHNFRTIAAGIISAAYSQPTRKIKDRIKFQAPDKNVLGAMSINRALSMSLSQRYQTLQALSYGTNVNIAMFNFMNNMNVSSAQMQNKFLQAFIKLSQGDGTKLGDLNQNDFFGNKIKVQRVGFLVQGSTPFDANKIQDGSVGDDAFLDMGGIAVKDTINQFEDKDSFSKISKSLTKMWETSPLQGLYQINSFAFIATSIVLGTLTAWGLGSIGLQLFGQWSNQGYVKELDILYQKQVKNYQAKWFEIGLETEVKSVKSTINPATINNLILRRAGVPFGIKAVDDLTRIRIEDDVSALSSKLIEFDQKQSNYATHFEEDLDRARKNLNEFEVQNKEYRKGHKSSKIDFNRRAGIKFKSIFTGEVVNYVSQGTSIIDNLLNDFTHKQVLEAYVEGQYHQMKANGRDTGKSLKQFKDTYLKDGTRGYFTFDQMLEQNAEDFNLFGKSRLVGTGLTKSAELMTEVYASRFDRIIDDYYDAFLDNQKQVFKINPADNLYTNFMGEVTNEAEAAAKLELTRFETKLKMRESIRNNIINRLNPSAKGLWNKIFSFISGGSVRDSLNRMSLEAADAAIDSINIMRQQGGNLFEVPSTQALSEADKALDAQIKAISNKGTSSNVPSVLPDPLKQTKGKLVAIEIMGLAGSALAYVLQATNLISTDLLMLRSAASIASSRTGDQEKEMAREEAAKTTFDYIFVALFFGALIGSSGGKDILGKAAGAGVGYIGYEFMFKHNIMSQSLGGITGIAATAIGITMTMRGKMGLGIFTALAGSVAITRSIIDLSKNDNAFLGQGKNIANFVNTLQYWGRDRIRDINYHAAGGLSVGLGIVEMVAAAKSTFSGPGAKLTRGLMFVVGLATMGLGLGRVIDQVIDKGRNSKLEATAMLGLTKGTNIVFNYIVATAMEKTVLNTAVENTAKWFASNAAKKATSNVVAGTVKTGAQAAGKMIAGKIVARAGLWGGRLLAGTFGLGPWGTIATVVTTAIELALILLAPEGTDTAVSVMTHNAKIGNFDVLTPSNQIYAEERYKDLDRRNPMDYDSVNNVMKKQWIEQNSGLDDVTGKLTSNRIFTSFNAEMSGYEVTGAGYGPGSADPLLDMTLMIRANNINQLVSGKLYWNSRLDARLNQAVVQKYISTSDTMLLQFWENQLNQSARRVNKITQKPQEQKITDVDVVLLDNVMSGFTSFANQINTVKDIKNKDNLVVKVSPTKLEDLNKDNTRLTNLPNTQTALHITKTNKDGKQQIYANTQSSNNSQQTVQVAATVKKEVKNNTVQNHLINPL